MSTKKTIATIIGVLLMFGCQFLPPVFGLTPLGMQVAGIFIGTILLWMFVSVTWPSILCIIALILSPLYTYSSGLSGSMGGWITSFVLFSSMVTYTLGQTGFLKRCAVWFVTRPWAQKNPWLFLGLLFLAPLVIGSFMSPIPAFIVCLPIAEQIFKELKYEKGDRFPQIVVLGILFFASLSTAATPIAHTVTTMALSLYENDAGVPVNFVSYTIFGVAACLVTFAASMVLTKFVCRPGTERLSSLDSSVLKSETTPMSRQEKYTLLVFVLVVAMWLLPGIIAPVLPEVASAISSLGTPTPAMIGACLLCVLHVEGKPLMNFNEAVAKGVPWGAVFMVAATSVLGSALTHEEAGITAVVSGAALPHHRQYVPHYLRAVYRPGHGHDHQLCLQHGHRHSDVQHLAAAGVRRSYFRGRSCRVDLRDRRLCLRGLRDSSLHRPRRHCGRVRMAEYGYDAQIWALVVRHSGRDLCGGGLPDRRGHHVTEGKESCLWNDSLMLLWSAAVPPVLQPL